MYEDVDRSLPPNASPFDVKWAVLVSCRPVCWHFRQKWICHMSERFWSTCIVFQTIKDITKLTMNKCQTWWRRTACITIEFTWTYSTKYLYSIYIIYYKHYHSPCACVNRTSTTHIFTRCPSIYSRYTPHLWDAPELYLDCSTAYLYFAAACTIHLCVRWQECNAKNRRRGIPF